MGDRLRERYGHAPRDWQPKGQRRLRQVDMTRKKYFLVSLLCIGESEMKLDLVVSWHHFSVVVVVAVPLPRLLLDLPLLLRRRRAPVHQESHSGTNSLLYLQLRNF